MTERVPIRRGEQLRPRLDLSLGGERDAGEHDPALKDSTSRLVAVYVLENPIDDSFHWCRRVDRHSTPRELLAAEVQPFDQLTFGNPPRTTTRG